MTKICDKCGMPLFDSDLYCKNCGYIIPRESVENKYLPNKNLAPIPVEPEEKKNILPIIIAGVIFVVIVVVLIIILTGNKESKTEKKPQPTTSSIPIPTEPVDPNAQGVSEIDYEGYHISLPDGYTAIKTGTYLTIKKAGSKVLMLLTISHMSYSDDAETQKEIEKMIVESKYKVDNIERKTYFGKSFTCLEISSVSSSSKSLFVVYADEKSTFMITITGDGTNYEYDILSDLSTSLIDSTIIDENT